MKSLKIIIVLAVLAFAFSGLTTTTEITQTEERTEMKKVDNDKYALKRKKGGSGSNA